LQNKSCVVCGSDVKEDLGYKIECGGLEVFPHICSKGCWKDLNERDGKKKKISKSKKRS
jgi:hypothetical protein